MSGKQSRTNYTRAYANEIKKAQNNKKGLPPRDKRGRFSVSGGVGPSTQEVFQEKSQPIPSYLKDIGFLL